MGIRLAGANGVEDGRYWADTARRSRETVVNSNLARNFNSYSCGRHTTVLGDICRFWAGLVDSGKEYT